MESTVRKYKYYVSVFSVYTAWIVIVIASFTLLGWKIGNPYLKSIIPTMPSMHPVTAFNFILLGITLIIFNKNSKLEKKNIISILFVISAFVILTGANRFLTYLFDFTSHIDRWVFNEIIDHDGISKLWMAPQTAFMFVLTGINILILTFNKGNYTRIVQIIFLICSFISLFAIFGYISSYSSQLYHIKNYNPIALHTAFCFFLLSFGFIALHKEKGFFSVMTSVHLGGKIFRRLIFFSILIPFLLGWFRVITIEHNLINPELAFSIIIVSVIIILSAIIWITSRQIDEIDIERKTAEAEMKKAVIIAEDAKKAQQRFLANMSHEIRTPLNSIVGFSDVLQKQNLDTTLQKEYLSHISSAGNMLLKLIGNILDFNKIEEGKVTINEDSFNIKEVISSSLYPYKFIANEKGLNFNLQFDQYLPDYVIGDRERIIQILINLIGNALKFTESGGITVNIANAGKNELQEARILFLVSDTGMGIPADKHDEIFKSFAQADNSISKKFGGSGLGLSIVKELVKAMGGEIQVTSPVPNGLGGLAGSTFWFTLDFKVDRTYKDPLIENHKKTSKFNRIVKVLIAEDNELNQKLASVVMYNLGCTPVFVNNGKEAVQLIKENEDFDIILMDVNMPIMNGYEATKIIREELKNNIPIIGLTANVYKDDIEKCLKAGMSSHLGKPYSQQQIFDQINKYCFDMKGTIKKDPVKEEEKYTDLEFIKNLINGDKEMLKQLIITFIEQKEDFIPKIDIALQNRNWADVEFLTHNMKSSIKVVGLDRIIPQVIMLENKSGNYKGLDNIPSLISEIKEALNQSVIELEAELMKL